MEERLGEMRKGSLRFFNSYKLELKHQNLVFLIECIIKCHGVKQSAKICAIGEQNVIN